MALSKPIELPNGIVLNYHRVCDIQTTVNQQINIQVASYINQAKRQEEQEAYKNGTGMNVFIEGSWYTTEYTDEGMSTPGAYAYLKTLPEFEGATDVFEEGEA